MKFPFRTVACCAALLAPAAHAQTTPAAQPVKTAMEFVGDYKAPRLSDGKPDLQGFWTNASVSRMERPAGYPLVLSDQQAAEIEGKSLFNVRLKTEKDFVDPNAPPPEKGKPLPGVGNYDVAWTDPGAIVATIKGEKRSSYLTFPENGRMPALTENGRALRSAALRRLGTGFDNPEERGGSERCLIIGTNGPPFGNYLYNNNFQIVQTPSHLMIMSEMIHDVRIAKIGGDYRAGDLNRWMGDSIANWDGDTLVVRTRNIDPRSGGAFISKNGTITERFTRISDDQILYEFEVDDPSVYTSAWRGQMPLSRLRGQTYEFACHEGNYGLVNILEGGRSNDRAGVENKVTSDRGE